MIFRNRVDAAEKLIPLLEKFRGENAVVLAIPRGAVPMGKHISARLNLPMGLLLVKKIGHPDNPEYAIGAVSLDHVHLDPRHTNIPQEWIQSETEKIRKTLRSRQSLYRQGSGEPELSKKTLIVVDDGLATGYTMHAAVTLLRKHHPNKVVVAVPVASPSAVRLLKNSVDELIVLSVPDDFSGVGQFYDEFEQVSDDEVMELMK